MKFYKISKDFRIFSYENLRKTKRLQPYYKYTHQLDLFFFGVLFGKNKEYK